MDSSYPLVADIVKSQGDIIPVPPRVLRTIVYVVLHAVATLLRF